ncbi:hypothetical protein [Nocardioides sp. 1609]|uniref:hypothetical protein n=1 Tax=Nocardioides sp. 1609 TaxID=2508327 RepID=UPI00106F5960|nr:hypothetical protein [Nocardioides sp. 1609]
MSSPTQPARRHPISAVVVLACLLGLATSGSATAALVITGKQIKDNSVSTKDIKNGSLKVADFKASEAAKLRGPAGAPGAPGSTGAAGASAFTPPPPGTVIKGGGILSAHVNAAGVPIRSYAPLPFTTATPLIDNGTGTGTNLYFGSENTPSLSAPDVDAARCPGTTTAPNPTAGTMCVYVQQASNVFAASGELYAGSNGVSDAAESSGFYLAASSAAAGSMTVRYVWAYQAP